MENLNFRILNIKDKDLYDIRNIVYTWDKKHYCFEHQENFIELDLIFKKQIAMFKDDELIGYGEITNFPKVEPSISYIINPEYRKNGYGKKLVVYLLKIAKEEIVKNYVKIEVLKKNLTGISFAESLDVDFLYFDDKKIVFKKNL